MSKEVSELCEQNLEWINPKRNTLEESSPFQLSIIRKVNSLDAIPENYSCIIVTTGNPSKLGFSREMFPKIAQRSNCKIIIANSSCITDEI